MARGAGSCQPTLSTPSAGPGPRLPPYPSLSTELRETRCKMQSQNYGSPLLCTVRSVRVRGLSILHIIGIQNSSLPQQTTSKYWSAIDSQRRGSLASGRFSPPAVTLGVAGFMTVPASRRAGRGKRGCEMFTKSEMAAERSLPALSWSADAEPLLRARREAQRPAVPGATPPPPPCGERGQSLPPNSSRSFCTR